MDQPKKSLEEILAENNLKVFRKMQYDSIINFVFENIKNRSIPSKFYYLFSILGLTVLLGYSIFLFSGNVIQPKDYFIWFVAGIFSGSILIIPFHELFHAVAYKFTGAPKIHFGMDLKQMIFYVAADRFIIGAKKFYFVALAPFLIINLITIAYIISDPSPEIIVGILTFILLHNLMCIGDFAMLSFFHKHRKKELCTFDIVEDKESYICEPLQKK